ncbi:hypothetical protein IPA_03150 [Ignicoccus pacificus DSM 13166]|uniref:Uncharacterized protein n=1 Tax=Ignicoccus pacificus DSM 13166 TaxID=940294 RepID=A0A977PJZ4_9CREN|nr:hypothetical protein IPA_03150 [Ignicoccus pacificus DSM 13166]
MRLEEREVERLLYVVPSIVLFLALTNTSMASLSFIGLLSSAVLYFLGYPGPATATLFSTAVSVGLKALDSYISQPRIIKIYTNTTVTKVLVVTAKSVEIRTSMITVTETLTETYFKTRNITLTNTKTITLTKTFCGKIIKLVSYTILPPARCDEVFACTAPPDVNLFIGENLTVGTMPLPGTPPTLIYTPIGRWENVECNSTFTLKEGERILIARPYFGQPPENVTISCVR